jgi:hypothetical protein
VVIGNDCKFPFHPEEAAENDKTEPFLITPEVFTESPNCSLTAFLYYFSAVGGQKESVTVSSFLLFYTIL